MVMLNKMIQKQYGRFAGEGDPDPKTVPFDPGKITPDFESESDEIVTMSQKQLSKIMGDTRGKFRGQALDATKKVTDLSEKLNLSAAERESLKGSIDQIRASLQSEVEKKNSEFETYKQATETQLKELKTALDQTTNSFHSTLIETEVHKACGLGGVEKPKQMLAYLSPKLKVVPVLAKDGKPTGKQKVAVLDTNESGDPVAYDVLDFIKKLDEAGEDQNLFTHNLKNGLGASNGGSNNPGKADVPKDPKELAKWLADPANKASLNSMPMARK